MSADPHTTQLSFDVGGERPNVASVKVSGGLALNRELRKGETVAIRIIDADGQLLAEGEGPVTAIGFHDKRNKYGLVESTERRHTVKAEPSGRSLP